MTVDEAYAYAYQEVRASGAAQTPQRWLSAGEGELLLARSPTGRPVIPATLPESLRAALESPLPNVRIGAVEVLRDWLTSDDPARVVSARQELEVVADHDMPLVATAARSALQHLRPPGVTRDSPSPSTSPSGAADDRNYPTAAAPSQPTSPSSPTKDVRGGFDADYDHPATIAAPKPTPRLGPTKEVRGDSPKGRGVIGSVIGVLVIIILVVVILQLT